MGANNADSARCLDADTRSSERVDHFVSPAQVDWISPKGILWRITQTEEKITVSIYDGEGFCEVGAVPFREETPQGVSSGESLHGQAEKDAGKEKEEMNCWQHWCVICETEWVSTLEFDTCPNGCRMSEKGSV